MKDVSMLMGSEDFFLREIGSWFKMHMGMQETLISQNHSGKSYYKTIVRQCGPSIDITIEINRVELSVCEIKPYYSQLI